MGRIVVTEFVSLDGIMAARGQGESLDLGWTFDFDRGEEGDKFKLDEALDSEALLLGRVTYEIFAASWPSSTEGEFADKFNSMPKYVVSSTLERADWNATILKGDVVEEVSRLRRAPGGDIVVHGSAQLAQTLIEHDLVDELRLMVFPVVLGTGKRLFDATSEWKRFRLAGSKTVGDGVAILVYQRAPRNTEAASPS
jgi:dihydrofolate reductase